MRKLIYDELKSIGFKEVVKNKADNKRLGVLKSFELGCLYAEVLPRKWGLSIQVYGGQFQKEYYPSNFDVCCGMDVLEVMREIKSICNYVVN